MKQTMKTTDEEIVYIRIEVLGIEEKNGRQKIDDQQATRNRTEIETTMLNSKCLGTNRVNQKKMIHNVN